LKFNYKFTIISDEIMNHDDYLWGIPYIYKETCPYL
jgi:hypothetical protein